jgi:peptidoglycan-associated lipoprotein
VELAEPPRRRIHRTLTTASGFRFSCELERSAQHPIEVDKNFRLTTSLLDLPHVPSEATNGGTGMTNVAVGVIRAARLAGFLALALAAAGCANRQGDPTAGAGSAAPGSQQDFVVNVGDRVFFESDSTELTPQSIATLEKQAQWLQVYNQYTFTIEGHADERGTREYNIALGARRAQTVRDYLTSRGVTAQRMHTISYGKERPVAVCNDISCWSQNRRAVTVLNTSS